METGWSVNYVLDKINVVQLSMMMADIPHYEEGRKMTPEELMKELERKDKDNQQVNKMPRKGVDPLTFFRDYAVKD